MAGLGFAKNAICQNMTERIIVELVKSEEKHTARNIAKELTSASSVDVFWKWISEFQQRMSVGMLILFFKG